MGLCVFQTIDIIRIRKEDSIKRKTQLLLLKRKKEVISLESDIVKPLDTPIMIGDPNASNDVTTIISPGCGHCRKTVAELLKLKERGCKFYWNIVMGNAKSDDDKLIRRWIHDYLTDKDIFIKQLKRWSTGKELRFISPKHFNEDMTSENEIYETIKETVSKNVTSGYPVIILNGRKLSPIYEPADLEYLIADNTVNDN